MRTLNKMKITVLVIALSISVAFPQYYPVDTAKLNTAYRELKKNPGSLECQKVFFHAFPSTWMEFVMTYQNPQFNF